MSTTRVITAFTTRGKKEKITTDVATWGELKPLLENAGIEVDKLLATENQNKSDLVNDAAVLPTVDFVIFFRPKETKSGSLSYKETRNAIKEAIEKYGVFKGSRLGIARLLRCHPWNPGGFDPVP